MSMTQRAYTLNEIDRMRAAVRALNEPLMFPGVLYQFSPEHDRYVIAEDQLRTYMLGGVDPKDLEEKARARYSEHAKERDAYCRMHHVG